MKPGEYLLADGDIVANDGRATAKIIVTHTGDRPIQIGSHYHFFEVNRALIFDRDAAYGARLNIPAGTAVRFEPGEEKEIEITPLAGARAVYGHNALVNGPLDDPAVKAKAAQRFREWSS
ncbi:MAG TPA: urease subunit beta [Capsulimonadaceae bacterium]|jgi:urease beta subunit